MGTITITETLKGPAGNEQVSFIVDASGITVRTTNDTASVSWEQLDDVESLSEVFGDWTVREFKVVVFTLGKIYSNKHAYKEL